MPVDVGAADAVYLDHAATTPLRPEALEAMLPLLTRDFGNASGMHAGARRAKTAIEEAREIVAAMLGGQPSEVVFTSGGTESDNLAIRGAAQAARAAGLGDTVVVTSFEHHAVLGAAEHLEREGFRVHFAPVDDRGIVDVDALSNLLDERTVLVSVMLVNNEVGTIQPIDAVASALRARAPRAVLHTDAVQALPWIDVAAHVRAADLITASAHKCGGPKGIGALLVRRRTPILPIIGGGGQERGLRSGTHNTAGIAGMGAACAATMRARVDEASDAARRRDRLESIISESIVDARVNGDAEHRTPGHLNVTFPGVDSESILLMLDRAGVAASAGSACQSGSMEPSHVLLAMGLTKELALSSVRFTLGASNSDTDVERAGRTIVETVTTLRSRQRERRRR